MQIESILVVCFMFHVFEIVRKKRIKEKKSKKKTQVIHSSNIFVRGIHLIYFYIYFKYNPRFFKFVLYSIFTTCNLLY